ncbi:MAG: ABC transporter permease [Candidatus Bipolaricaulota bacterium]|nr:MAG: ABC transporter permease [Candidatus Bipolaricaulota bacterium]
MIGYIVRRLLAMLPVFFLVALIAFGLVCIAPGDFYTPLRLLGIHSTAYESMRVMRGIDKPWIVQFWIWFEGVITRGDFGISFATGGPVGPYIFSKEAGMQWTLIITGSSMILAWLAGIPLGILAAVRKRKPLDYLVSVLAYVGISFPQYVLGWCFIWFVYKFINRLIISPGTWGLVDVALRREPMSVAKFGSYVWHLTPAWIIVGAPMFALVVRHMRNSMLDTMNEHYMDTARAKGLRESRVLLKHALRNALNPLISMAGMMIPTLITGSILATQVLGLPTFGQVLITATRSQDQHLLTACLLFYASLLLVGNLIADLGLAVVDPRIRYR